ncbi:hypothetical protein D9611_009716 [Ephemerocybe angulata]|uniref:Helicase ATP-binding domain-containing protein n=1 Tax=Ephemerocybe angulata TaxID=980116 RepID=A0A8H5FGK4_9AGAR|nr:hypothetical protein D9611_009716 [Tulosesus angulatus]
MQYYLGLLNRQLPIESQFVEKLADNLNAEIVLGTVRSREEAVEWLGYILTGEFAFDLLALLVTESYSSFSYVRMLRSPALYGVSVDYQDPSDPTFLQKRADIIHSAVVHLEKCQLIKYERGGKGRFVGTELGRIASHYYAVARVVFSAQSSVASPATTTLVSYNSMVVYNQHLRENMGMLELFRVFALSNEFKNIPVRPEEKMELAWLLERVPIPVKETVDEPPAKINVLLQAYISGFKLDGFVLVADMVFVQQKVRFDSLLSSLPSILIFVGYRILRAMFEIYLKRGWAIPAKAALEMCKMVEKRMWGSMTPLRQFPKVPAEVIRKAEGKQFPWYRYFDLSPPEIGELLGLPKEGRRVHRLVHTFPKLQYVQPITRSLLRVDLSIVPDFQWDPNVHGGAESFHILVEDVDSEVILYHDIFILRQRYAQDEHNVTITVPMFEPVIVPDFQWDPNVHGGAESFHILVEDVDSEVILYHDIFILRQRYAQDEHNVTITVPMFEPVPPNYYISLISDRWLHAETCLPISFKHLILPEKFPPPTPLLDLQPLPLTALHNKEFESIYAQRIKNFNKIQTQVFQALYTTDENVFIGAPAGSGKTVCAEFALMRLWSAKGEQKRAVCIEPYQEMVDMRVKEWKEKFGDVQGGKEFVSLTGETSADLRLLEKGDGIVCTPTQWDVISRRWRQRKNVQNIGLLIADEIQMVGGEVGPTYEVVISRTRYVSAQTEIKTRIVACSVSIANARDLGEWMGAPSHAIFNFAPSARPLDMDIHLQSFSIPHFPSLMITMSKPAYLAISEYSPTKPVIVFVPSRRQCTLTVDDLLTHASAEGKADRFLNIELEDLQPHLDHLREDQCPSASLDSSSTDSFSSPFAFSSPTWYSCNSRLVLRVMFEIFLKRGWAPPAKAALDMCSGKQFPWYRYFDLSPPEIGETCFTSISRFWPDRLTIHRLQAQVQPITRSLIRIDLSIVPPGFQWDPEVHGGAESFQILVEDVDERAIRTGRAQHHDHRPPSPCSSPFPHGLDFTASGTATAWRSEMAAARPWSFRWRRGTPLRRKKRAATTATGRL